MSVASHDFGTSVAISGDTIIVGARRAPGAVERAGAAYVFRLRARKWVEQAILTAPDGARNDEFGYAVAARGDVAVVGAWYDDDNGSDSGSVYVFRRTGRQ